MNATQEAPVTVAPVAGGETTNNPMNKETKMTENQTTDDRATLQAFLAEHPTVTPPAWADVAESYVDGDWRGEGMPSIFWMRSFNVDNIASIGLSEVVDIDRDDVVTSEPVSGYAFVPDGAPRSVEDLRQLAKAFTDAADLLERITGSAS